MEAAAAVRELRPAGLRLDDATVAAALAATVGETWPLAYQSQPAALATAVRQVRMSRRAPQSGRHSVAPTPYRSPSRTPATGGTNVWLCRSGGSSFRAYHR